MYYLRWNEQIADNMAAVKTHSYWTMLNSQGEAGNIQQSLDDIAFHFQGTFTVIV